MAYSDDYQKLVLDDIKTFAGIYRPVKSSILARICIRRLPIRSMHPNPEDEFCQPSIGPNESIISDYIRSISHNLERGDPPVEEKLIVQKISTGGYMLLNGHHRWMAAAKIKLDWLPVSIVNPMTDEEVISAINRSDRRMCVSFDLDEVLLTDCKSDQADHRLPFPYNFIFKRTLRKNAGLLIKELENLGFDVWTYSGSGMAQEEVNRLMKLHKAKVSGVITLLKGKKANANLQQAFKNNYDLSLHIDNECILWVNTNTRAYDSIPVEGGNAWASDVLTKVRALDEMKRINGEKSNA